ncbi:MAG: hypothetical protein B7Y45_11465 [Sphingomonas sp. 28-66-16]|nr:MAG: hypothetical protein B7Y45_11465 [Sphingomonas sp. 28-66-16]
MKSTIAILGVLALLPLAACDKGKGDDALAANITEAADNRADMIDNQAEMMKDQADQIRDNAENRADAVDDADVNANAMTPAQREAIINNTAPVPQ